MYAPASKSWDWQDLSPLTSRRCMFIGDFNIDLEQDNEKASKMLDWMDTCGLGPIVPENSTSLRSNRTIDYAMVAGVCFTVQTHERPTNSDHKPLIGVLTVDGLQKKIRSRTHWTVFQLVLSYTYSYWGKQCDTGNYDYTYEQFITFLALLHLRCKQYFMANLARLSVPHPLMELSAKSRILSFKAKRKGDIALMQEARQMRNYVRFELKRFRQEQLIQLLRDR